MVYLLGGINSLLLLSSSYTVFTYFLRPFSNVIESILVVSVTLLCQRSKSKSAYSFLGVILSAGIYNRPTFLAFVLPSCLTLLFNVSIFSLIICGMSSVVTMCFFTIMDTYYYSGHLFPLISTLLNNIQYNTEMSNLELHGIHPSWTHALLNLPLLIGPAVLYIWNFNQTLQPLIFNSICGIALLSVIPHQEARFLLPCVPMLLVVVGRSLRNKNKVFIHIWIIFNVGLFVLLGIFQQGGIVPILFSMKKIILNNPKDIFCVSSSEIQFIEINWWKTYPPPLSMGAFDSHEPIYTNVHYGIDLNILQSKLIDHELIVKLDKEQSCLISKSLTRKYLVFPDSSQGLLQSQIVMSPSNITGSGLWFIPLYGKRYHLNLDDLNFENGKISEIIRVAKIGLTVYSVVYSK